MGLIAERYEVEIVKRKMPEGEILEEHIRRYRSGEDAMVLAGEVGMTVRSYREGINALGVFREVPQSIKPSYREAPVIKGECLITCDEQIPFHDGEFLNRVLEVASAWGIEQGISAGDTINETAFSHFTHRPEDTWVEEREVAKKVLNSMAEAVPKWLMLAGNHTVTLIRLLAEQFKMEDILRLLDRPKGFKATDYYYCKVQVGGSLWRISHPRNISVFHGRVPQKLINKYHCNVAAGHGHLVGMMPSESGDFMAVDIGICADPMRLDYAALRDTTRPAMNQGALILKRGDDGKCHPYLLTPNADWGAMKRLYKC